MASYDHDLSIVGSGFGGSVAALRAAEKGYRVGVMESGRRSHNEDIPKTQRDLPHFIRMPGAELYGKQFFDAPEWAEFTDWADEHLAEKAGAHGPRPARSPRPDPARGRRLRSPRPPPWLDPALDPPALRPVTGGYRRILA